MTGYITGTGNQLTSDGTWNYTYDNEGNQVTKTKISTSEKWTFAYDTNNRLVSAVDATSIGTTLATDYIAYDVFGNRIEQDTWTQSSGTTVTRFTYDGQNVLADLTSGNALQTRYVRGDAPDQIFARISSGGTAGWYLSDRQGSVRDLTDNTGAIQDHIDYDGFGNVTNESHAAFGDRYKYTGREFDGVTGLQYNRARYYDPTNGRWISQDPLGFDAGDANTYRYVGNNPPNLTDPSGLRDFRKGSHHNLRLKGGSYVFLLSGNVVSGYNHTTIIVWDQDKGSGIAYDGGGPGGKDPVQVYFLDPNVRKKFHSVTDMNTEIRGHLWMQLVHASPKSPSYSKVVKVGQVFAAMQQVPIYQPIAADAPNSNSFAHQLLKLAGLDCTPPGACPGWDYKGEHRYGGLYWDAYGYPTKMGCDLITNGVWANPFAYSGCLGWP